MINKLLNMKKNLKLSLDYDKQIIEHEKEFETQFRLKQIPIWSSKATRKENILDTVYLIFTNRTNINIAIK